MKKNIYLSPVIEYIVIDSSEYFMIGSFESNIGINYGGDAENHMEADVSYTKYNDLW